MGDYRGSATSDIYAQRISATGTVQWTANGVALCSVTGDQNAPTIVSDGAGGAIVAWRDDRGANNNYGVYAQRISAAGTVQWTANGVALVTATSAYAGISHTIVSDGTGGAIVTWSDNRNGSIDIYAQRILAGGTVQWTANGVALCTAAGSQYISAAVSDGAGGAIVAWDDGRSGSGDIYARRILAGGTVQWTANGVALCTAAETQSYPTIASDGASGAIVVWGDSRSGNQDIYAQNVKANGELGGYPGADVPTATASLTFALDPVRPNPSRGGALTVHFSLPIDAPARVDLLDVAGRRIASHEVGIGQHTLDLGVGQHLTPGLYLVRLTQGANTRTTRVAVLN